VTDENEWKRPCALELRLLMPPDLCGKCGWPAGNHSNYPADVRAKAEARAQAEAEAAQGEGGEKEPQTEEPQC
jgi:hypothetical protein